ncbi:hypothetical protein SDRG_09724 [Saprolegnia diclina VS20]|uniref:Initiation factor eIF2 gamma C-terminal domain-containing protein n=1 Tax=Saprolegnia diclina (strain VS20) TaxID=1156394 RepID=T0RRJ9_SAPDV|nr:hypothetical protein SDRG_09724 [Saprolegnia diclina VS20]EQC32752.1 hypothetical protein SDRG_09724 [Saprolegnia diclina VS20]|eukprot:XP_008613896.1 hypothetical protein SDRG_09724 [Saprolegnia diclina VS20]
MAPCAHDDVSSMLSVGLRGDATAAFVHALTNKPVCRRLAPWRHTHVHIYRHGGALQARAGGRPVDALHDENGRHWTRVRSVSLVDDPHLLLPLQAALVVPSEKDLALRQLCTLPTPTWNTTEAPQMRVLQSFDPNPTGAASATLRGGVAVGAITHGVLRVDDIVELRPGRFVRDVSSGRLRCTPLRTRITALKVASTAVDEAGPSALVRIATTLDPTLTRAHRLMGQVLGLPGTLPPIYMALTVVMDVGSRLMCTKDVVRVHIGATTVDATVLSVAGDGVQLTLAAPVCAHVGETIVLTRRHHARWRTLGHGTLADGEYADMTVA